ncbi:MAG: 50S ribosomal protein L17 [Alphaproteobacteria bacterium]|nr:50S ribosomal protein L17 [Alphaproteobacteria bacterium]
MRHRKAGRKLGMNSPQRKSLFRNMVTSLVLHGRIHTTEARAKELKRFADRVISIAKRAPSAAAIEALSGDEARAAAAQRVHAIRRARIWLNDRTALDKLFAEVAPGFAERPGGYTRVVKSSFRGGDNAPMAIIELVGTSQREAEGTGEAAQAAAEE